MTAQPRQLDEEDRITIDRTNSMVRELIQRWHAKTDRSPSSRAAGALFVRISGSWKSVCKLLDNCTDLHAVELVSNDVAALVRCMHDACLQAQYILRGDSSRGYTPDALGQLYLDFEIIERYRMAKRAVTFTSKLAQRLASSPRRAAGEAFNQQEFDRVKDAYLVGSGPRVRNHWYVGHLADIAERLGREEEYFWFLHSFNSSIHGGPSAVFKGPAPSGANLMHLAHDTLCRAAKLLATADAIELSDSSKEVLEAASDDFLNLDPGSA